MLIRRIARPMLSAVFISRGIDALRSPKPAADAARDESPSQDHRREGTINILEKCNFELRGGARIASAALRTSTAFGSTPLKRAAGFPNRLRFRVKARFATGPAGDARLYLTELRSASSGACVWSTAALARAV